MKFLFLGTAVVAISVFATTGLAQKAAISNPASERTNGPELEEALQKSSQRMDQGFQAGENRAVSGAQSLTVKNRRVEVLQGGVGKYTVVFESGLGAGLPAWERFALKLEGVARWVCYSRAGYRSSDSVPGERSPRQAAEELHELLTTGDFKPPFILVGHSYGGLCARMYAALYPQEVAGLVLDDPTYERFNFNLKEIAPELFSTLTYVPPNTAGPIKAEIAGMKTTYDLGRLDLEKSEPDVPTVLFTSMAPPKEVPPSLLPIFGKLAAAKQLAHRSWLASRTESMHVVTAQSSHSVHDDDPTAVIDAIRWTIRKADRLSGGN